MVKIEEIFSGESLVIINKYRKLLASIAPNYDYVVFMARKAICFYKALEINNEINSLKPLGAIISSSIFTYDCKFIKNKNAAIVDDVVVKGDTLEKTYKSLKNIGVEKIDIYFIACSDEFEKKCSDKEFEPNIKKNYSVLTPSNIKTLSSDIINYINASRGFYNIDYPIFTSNLNNIQINKIIKLNEFYDLTSNIQCHFNLRSYVVNFNEKILEYAFNSKNVPIIKIEKMMFKIRFLVDNNDELINTANSVFIPILLLPELNEKEIDKFFCCFATEGIIKMVETKDEYENKFKCIQYYLSSIIFNYIIENNFLEIADAILKYSKINQNYLFPLNSAYIHFLNDLFPTKISTNSNIIFKNTCQIVNNLNIFQMNEIIKAFYKVFDSFEHEEEITLSKLAEKISTTSKSISTITDIAIDRGLFVPKILVNGGLLVRGYKKSEFSELQEEHFNLFAYMLDFYSKHFKKDDKEMLDRTETEKLCVLFFEELLNNNIFKKNTVHCRDYFSKCYTRYGAVLSNSNKPYKASTDTRFVNSYLVDDDEYDYERRYITIDKYSKKYIVKPKSIRYDIISEKWKDEAEDFAFKYGRILNFIKEFKVKTYYVSTFNQFLTLKSIGAESKDWLIAILAELNLFNSFIYKYIRDDNFFDTDNNIIKLTNDLDSLIGGLNSGLWKYICYRENEFQKFGDSLLNEIKKRVNEPKYSMETYKAVNKIVKSYKYNLNEDIEPTINDCAELIFEILSNISSMRKYIKDVIKQKCDKQHLPQLKELVGAAKYFGEKSFCIIDHNAVNFKEQIDDFIRITYYTINTIIEKTDYYNDNNKSKFDINNNICVIRKRSSFEYPEWLLSKNNVSALKFPSEYIAYKIEKNFDLENNLKELKRELPKDSIFDIVFLKNIPWYFSVLTNDVDTVNKNAIDLIGKILPNVDKDPFSKLYYNVDNMKTNTNIKNYIKWEKIERDLKMGNKNGLNIALMVTTKREYEVLLEVLKEKNLHANDDNKSGLFYKYLKVNNICLYIVQSGMGTNGPNGSFNTTHDIIDVLSPKYIIMGGIAFGIKGKDVKMSDVLVSTNIWDYETAKISNGNLDYRGDKIPVSPELLQLFNRGSVESDLNYQTHFGLMGGGSKNVDDIDFIEKLVARESRLIGGEMEGMGVASTCFKKKIDCIIIKAICDWGTNKGDDYQYDAAKNSFDFIIRNILTIKTTEL